MGTMEQFEKKIPEQCCFECKDGGEGLLVCDYKNCLKSYHPNCTVRNEFPPRGEPFICNWHTCVGCRKTSDYQCLCCPNYSVCRNCLRKIMFFKVGMQNKGLCRFCIDLATLIEKNAADLQDEFNDIIPLVEKGLLKRATVMEFKEKVAAVHTDIANHWIDKELKRLEKEIGIANEKGWYKEMGELMGRKKLLSTPAERQRLLEVIPEIDADVEDENSRGVAEGASGSFEILKEKPQEGVADQVADSLRICEEESPEGATKETAHSYSRSLNEESTQEDSKTRSIDIGKGEDNYTKSNKGSKVPVHEVIDLDSNDEEDVRGPERETMHSPTGDMKCGDLHREQPELHTQGATALWHYIDPQGDTQGPFELTKLWEWKRGGFFDENFKVWETGKTKEHFILLTDAFRMNL